MKLWTFSLQQIYSTVPEFKSCLETIEHKYPQLSADDVVNMLINNNPERIAKQREREREEKKREEEMEKEKKKAARDAKQKEREVKEREKEAQKQAQIEAQSELVAF